jgi:hypothetical protein
MAATTEKENLDMVEPTLRRHKHVVGTLYNGIDGAA